MPADRPFSSSCAHLAGSFLQANLSSVLGYSPGFQAAPACLYILSAETHHTVSEFDQLSCRNAKSHETLLKQAQALDAAQAYMLRVSEQVSLAELATELAEARAAFMEQRPGNALYAMTGLDCVQKSLAVFHWFAKPRYPSQHFCMCRFMTSCFIDVTVAFLRVLVNFVNLWAS